MTTVQDLRDTLARLVELLQASDARATTIRGLTDFLEATAPFADVTLKSFVKLAESGRAPAAPKPSPKPKAGGKSKADPAAVAGDVTDLYRRAGDPAVTEEQVRAACARLGDLTKDALVKLADGIGLSGMKAKNKGDIVSDITNRLLDRKGAAIHRTLIDRPVPPGGSHPVASDTPVGSGT